MGITPAALGREGWGYKSYQVIRDGGFRKTRQSFCFSASLLYKAFDPKFKRRGVRQLPGIQRLLKKILWAIQTYGSLTEDKRVYLLCRTTLLESSGKALILIITEELPRLMSWR